LKERAAVVIDALESLRDPGEVPISRPAIWPELLDNPRAVLLQTLQMRAFNWKYVPAVSDASAWLRQFEEWLK
jgi:hypothetical protein